MNKTEGKKCLAIAAAGNCTFDSGPLIREGPTCVPCLESHDEDGKYIPICDRCDNCEERNWLGIEMLTCLAEAEGFNDRDYK
jgi:hypothetical protein